MILIRLCPAAAIPQPLLLQRLPVYSTKLLVAFLFLFLHADAATTAAIAAESSSNTYTAHHNKRSYHHYSIPEETCSPFGAYPNPLRLTDQDRARFHPVIVYPPSSSSSSSSIVDKKKDARIIGTNSLGVAILDHTQPPSSRSTTDQDDDDDVPVPAEMVTEEERELSARGELLQHHDDPNRNTTTIWKGFYGIGRYDENRKFMYTSEHYDVGNTDGGSGRSDEHYNDRNNNNNNNNDNGGGSDGIDGFTGLRTLHIGIDLDGPLYTPVHAFWHGTVHAVGYNPDLGDYGHVIVVRHVLPPPEDEDDADDDDDDREDKREEEESSCDAIEGKEGGDDSATTTDDPPGKLTSRGTNGRTVFALYGHLADFSKPPPAASTTSTTSETSSSSSSPSPSGTTTTKSSSATILKVGDVVQRGQVLGYLGEVHDNGGWRIPHVHFQLALEAPSTHDMPGAVSMDDRARALVLYPDPRYVLGPLH